MPSFRLIGLDKDRNEYPFEYPGLSAKDAAKKGGQARGYLEVLNGDESGLRSGKSNGIYYKQSLWKPSFADKHMRPNGKGALAQSIEETFDDSGASLLQTLRARGVELSLVVDEESQHTKLKVDRPFHAGIAEHEWEEKFKPALEIHKNRIVKILRKELELIQSSAPGDLYKGQTRREVMKKILPQMPTRFKRGDFVKRLQELNYIEFAHDEVAVTNGFTDAKAKGYMIQTPTRGVYEVSPELKSGKPKTEIDSNVIVNPASLVPAEVAPPLDNPLPINEPTLSDAFVSAFEKLAEPAPPEAPRNATHLLFALATETFLGPEDGELLAMEAEEAATAFENAIMEAAAQYVSVVKRLTERIRAETTARKSLRQLTQEAARTG